MSDNIKNISKYDEERNFLNIIKMNTFDLDYLFDNKSNIDIIDNGNYCYIIQEREFIKTKESIYKIGKTAKGCCKRFKKYPKGSILILLLKVDCCDIIENKIINIFDYKFIQRKDIGREYYEGCITDMIKEMEHIVKNEINIPHDEKIAQLINLNNDMEKQLDEKNKEINILRQEIEKYKDTDKILLKKSINEVKKENKIVTMKENIFDNFMMFLNKNTQKTNNCKDNKKLNFLYDKLKNDSYYTNLNFESKRMGNYKYICNEVEKTLKEYFVPTSSNVKILQNYKWLDDSNSSEESESGLNFESIEEKPKKKSKIMNRQKEK